MAKNILVTGSHRSGSTWTGQVLARAPGVHYIHEPFNVGFPRYRSPLTCWFEYLDSSLPEQAQRVRTYLDSFVTPFHKQKLARVFRSPTFKDALLGLKDLFDGLGASRHVIKDPIAIMSAAWIYETFG